MKTFKKLTCESCQHKELSVMTVHLTMPPSLLKKKQKNCYFFNGQIQNDQSLCWESLMMTGFKAAITSYNWWLKKCKYSEADVGHVRCPKI